MRKVLFLAVLLLPMLAQARSANDILKGVYPTMSNACIETSVTTTGANRSAQLDQGQYYLLYGTDNTAVGTFEALECIQGGSAVDVTSDGPGFELAAGEKILIYTGSTGRYVSCISANASKHYHLCKAQP